MTVRFFESGWNSSRYNLDYRNHLGGWAIMCNSWPTVFIVFSIQYENERVTGFSEISTSGPLGRHQLWSKLLWYHSVQVLEIESSRPRQFQVRNHGKNQYLLPLSLFEPRCGLVEYWLDQIWVPPNFILIPGNKIGSTAMH